MTLLKVAGGKSLLGSLQFKDGDRRGGKMRRVAA